MPSVELVMLWRLGRALLIGLALSAPSLIAFLLWSTAKSMPLPPCLSNRRETACTLSPPCQPRTVVQAYMP